MWAAAETPESSGNFTTSRIPFSCAKDTPIQCTPVAGSSLPSLGYIFSFGEDNQKDIYILASSGVYRVVRPSRCNYTCSKESVTPPATTQGPTAPRSYASQLHGPYSMIVILFSSLLLHLLGVI